MSAELLGDDFTLNWDQDGSYSSPNWLATVSVGDLGFDPANEQVEVPKRISVKTYKKGRGDWSLSFTMNYDKTNAFHVAVRNAITNGSKIHMAIADGDIASSNYWHAWWFLSGPLDASLDTVANIEVEGKCHNDIGADDSEIPAFVAAA